jgi:hypothetical protein
MGHSGAPGAAPLIRQVAEPPLGQGWFPARPPGCGLVPLRALLARPSPCHRAGSAPTIAPTNE